MKYTFIYIISNKGEFVRIDLLILKYKMDHFFHLYRHHQQVIFLLILKFFFSSQNNYYLQPKRATFNIVNFFKKPAFP